MNILSIFDRLKTWNSKKILFIMIKIIISIMNVIIFMIIIIMIMIMIMIIMIIIVPTFDTKVTEYLCSGWVFFSSDKFRLFN